MWKVINTFVRRKDPMENKFLKVKKCENHNYFYAERLGKDSVAFILYDHNTRKFGLILEYKPPIEAFLATAFGGSIDKTCSLQQIVEDEVREEAGYSGARIIYQGKAFVSTQMNQFCHLYLVDVTNAVLGKPEPENDMESIVSVVWQDRADVALGDCWKAATIILRSGL